LTINHIKIKIMKNILFFICFLLNFQLLSQAQEVNVKEVDHSIKLITKDYGNKHVLRWGFSSPEAWYSALKLGVQVEQVEIKKSGSVTKEIKRVMPMEEAPLEQLASEELEAQDMLVVVLQNIHRDWDNSLYDGPENILEKADNFRNRWSLVHFAADKNSKAADAAGLRLEVPISDRTKKYAYRVKVGGKYRSTSSSVLFPARKVSPLIFDIEVKESSLVLKWDRATHDHLYSGYFIERSTDGVNFLRLNDLPYVQMIEKEFQGTINKYTYQDAVETGKQYSYRLVGLDPFGDESIPSPVVKVDAIDKTPPMKPQMMHVRNKEHLTIGFEWTQENPEEVKEYYLEHMHGDGTNTIIKFADGTARTKTLKVNRKGIHSFRLIAVDESGNTAYSDMYNGNAVDVYPPSAPVGLKAECDTNGVVTIVWDEAIEDDVIGYYLFSADSNDRTFKSLNGRSHSSRIFLDTLSTKLLNEKKEYKVVAIDSDGKRSKFSEPVTAILPDLIPPSPAMISDYKVMRGYIQLSLRPSTSRDVVMHKLQRKTSQSEWTTILEKLDTGLMFRDSTVISNTKYKYRFYAIDDAGLESKIVKEINLRSKRSFENVEVEFIPTENTITMTWSANEDVDKIVWYKKNSEGKYTISRSKASDMSYVDKEVVLGNTYSYKYQVIYNDGKKSPFFQGETVSL
jgi:fibronectin type 3 domain-containing protein